MALSVRCLQPFKPEEAAHGLEDALGLTRKMLAEALAKGEQAIVDEFEGAAARDEDKANLDYVLRRMFFALYSTGVATALSSVSKPYDTEDLSVTEGSPIPEMQLMCRDARVIDELMSMIIAPLEHFCCYRFAHRNPRCARTTAPEGGIFG